jgi:Ca2+-binding RTX toxin-like protein
MSIFSPWPRAAVRQRRRRATRAGKAVRARRRFEPLESRQLLTVTIDGSPTIYNTIQAAINAAVAGNTVRVGAGTYAENVLVNKSISVVGATGTPSDVVIDPVSGVGVTITASGVTLQSLRVTGATASGIQADSVANLIFNSVNSDHNSGDGAHLTNLSGTLMVLSGAYSNNLSDGIELAGESGTASITSTIFNANTGLGIHAANALQQGTLNLSDLTLTNNLGGAGASLATFNTLNFTSTLAATADTISLSSSQFQLTRGMSLQQVVQYSGVANLEIDTLDGADTLNVTSTADATATTINADSGVDQFGDIDLTQVGAAGLSLNAGGDGESIVMNTTTAGTVGVTASQVQRTGNGAVSYSGFAALTVNGTAGADTFNVASTADATATTINAGSGLDVFGDIDLTQMGGAGLTLNAGNDGESIAMNTTMVGTVGVTSSQVQRFGNGAATYSGFANLTVNGTAGADMFNVVGTADATATTINSGDGVDLFGDIDLTQIGLAGLTINAGSGAAQIITLNTTATGTVTVSNMQVQRAGNGPVAYSGFASLTVNGTAGADTLDVISTAAGTSYAINAGAANDLITIGSTGSLDGILGALSIEGGANDALPISTLTCGLVTNSLPVGDTIYFNDSATLADSTYSLHDAAFSRTNVPTAGVTYADIETIRLDTGAGNDTIDVADTPASANVFVDGNAGGDTISLAANGAGSNVVLSGDGGDDIINVQSVATSSIVQVNGDDDNDTVNVSSDAPANAGTLNAIVGSLCIDTGLGSDKIILSDQDQTLFGNIIVADNSVTGFAGPTNNVPIYFQFAGTLELTLIGSQTLVDKFNVELSTYPQSPSLTLQFDGSGQPAGGMDKVRIDGTTANDFIEVGLFGSGRSFQVQNIECLQIFGGVGDDTLRNDTNTSSLIDGGDGGDLLIGGSNADVIFGGDGVDVIFGRGGGDFLFGDHEFNNRKPRAKHPVAGDYIFGDRGFDPQFPHGFDPKHPGVVTPGSLTDPFAKTAGVDTIVTIGLDFVDAGGEVGDTIIGSGVNILSVEDWLRARFLTSNAKHIQAAITKALAKPCTML